MGSPEEGYVRICAWCFEDGKVKVLKGKHPGETKLRIMIAQGRVSHGMCYAHYKLCRKEAELLCK
jgi:hypothetical protein